MRFDERALNGIGTFSAIVRSGSFARAGEILDMSQSGVSRAVARLEGRLGIRLFDRTTRSVTLTDEGRRFHEQIVPLLAGLEEAAAAAAEGTVKVRGRLRVNLDPFFSRHVLSPRLGGFLREHPELQLELLTRDDLGDMVGDGFDVAIRFGVPKASSLVGRKLMDCRVVTVATPGYLKRHGRPLKPQDLMGGEHVCIQFRDSQTGRPFPWEFIRSKRRLVLETQGQLILNDAGTLHGTVLAGYGIAQMFDMGIESLLAEGRLIDLFPDWGDETFPLYAYTPSRAHVPAKTRAFLEFIQALQT